jgi:hypothetical protein
MSASTHTRNPQDAAQIADLLDEHLRPRSPRGCPRTTSSSSGCG